MNESRRMGFAGPHWDLWTVFESIANAALFVVFVAILIRRLSSGSARPGAGSDDEGADEPRADEAGGPSNGDPPEPEEDLPPPSHDLNDLIRDFDELGFVAFRLGRDAEQFDAFMGFVRKRNVRCFTEIDKERGVVMVCRRPQGYIMGIQ